jgi:DNA-directed RNA polymerase subunit RPC12/RpoP
MDNGKAQKALEIAQDLAKKSETATDFHNAFFGIGGRFGEMLIIRTELQGLIMERKERLARQIVAIPHNAPCPACGGVVHDWHSEWTDPAHGSDFYQGKRAIDCPLCNAWLLYKERQIQAVPTGESPQHTKRLPLQAARWAKSQCKEGTLRGYLDHNTVGKQYADYFDDSDIQAADLDAQADPRF